MKIDSLPPSPLSPNQTDGASPVKSGGHSDQTARVHGSSDRADLSDRGRLLGKARAALQTLPEVNEDKVKDVKQRVANGTYTVPADELARRLLNRLNQIPPE